MHRNKSSSVGPASVIIFGFGFAVLVFLNDFPFPVKSKNKSNSNNRKAIYIANELTFCWYRVSHHRLPFLYLLQLKIGYEFCIKINLILILRHETIIWKYVKLCLISVASYFFTFVKLLFLKLPFLWKLKFPNSCLNEF